MLAFGLCSTYDDQLSNPSDESCPSAEKWIPNCKKLKGSFLDYV